MTKIDISTTAAEADLLGSPFQIGRLTVKNRLFKPAMSEQLADRHHNPRADIMARLYARWAEGGIGLMLSGNIMVDRNALGEPSNVVLDAQSDLDAFRQWVAGAKTQGVRFFAQLNHPGKQIPRFLHSQPMAPSAIPIEGPLASGFKPPREMTEEDIGRVIGLFADAARMAKEVGFDGIQIHGAHGYLVNQFLSPRHNRRTDKWAEPALFLMTVYAAIRAEVGDDFPVIIKLNSSDFEKGGYSEADAIEVMLKLQQAGIDAIEVSGGTYEAQVMMGEGQQGHGGYFVEFARGAKAQLDIPVMVTGGFRTRGHVVEALSDGVDMTGIGRPLILDPDLPSKMLAGEEGAFTGRMRSSGWKYLDSISLLSWFEMQMLRLGRGLEPRPEMHVARAVIHALSHAGFKVLAPRRG